MAINPETKYAGKIKPSSAAYPYGEARNITVPGDGTGTPWEAALVNDVFGMQQRLLSLLGVTPSGSPDTAETSQYVDAMWQLLAGSRTLTHNMTADANYTLQGDEYLYSRYVITDTGSILTGVKSIVIGVTEREFVAVNRTEQDLTFKTATGVGVSVPTGRTVLLRCDGVNVVNADALNYKSPLKQSRAIVDFNTINTEAAALQRYRLNKQGPGSGNVIQGFAVDPYEGELFTLHVTGDPETTVINRFTSNGARTITSTHYLSAGVSTLGHQALSISWDENGERWFWVSAHTSVTDYSQYVTRFQVDLGAGTDLTISNIQNIKVYEDASATGYCTPTVSVDGRYLVTETDIGGDEYIRVFDLNAIQAGGAGDYSAEYLSEFTFPTTSSNYPLQSLACDGAFIYLVFGSGDLAYNSYIEVWSLDGIKVHTISDFIIGKSLALTDGAGAYYEPEGTGWVWDNGRPYLSVSIASGDSGNRVNRVFALGAYLPNVSYGDGNEPAFISAGYNDFGVTDGETIRFGHYNPDTDTFTEHMAVDPSGNTSLTSFETGTFTVTAEDSATKGAGNISSTVGLGKFTRVGNIMHVRIAIEAIDTTGLTSTNNLYLHFEGADNAGFFNKLAISDTEMAARFNYVTTSGIQLVAEWDSNGYVAVLEVNNGANSTIADVSQFTSGDADIYVNGTYQINI